MDYKNFINEILQTRGRFAISKNEYKERHHIIPRCLGGTNDENNLIDLYAREHIIAHKLLMNENPKNKSLIFAYIRMIFGGNKENPRTFEEYEEARKIYSNLRKNSSPWNKGMKMNKEFCENCKKYCHSQTKETREKISKSFKGVNTWIKGRHWYNNGISSAQLKFCPEGWKLGRLFKKKQNKNNKKLQFLQLFLKNSEN